MKKFLIIFLILLIISGLIFFFRNDLLNFYQKIFPQLTDIQKGLSDLVKEAQRQISTPEPLRAEKESEKAFLTKEGVIEWTNVQREKYGLPPLKESAELDASAAIKIEDMFQKQYFAHVSPAGEGVGELAEYAGYEFIAVGENLALGNFENDETLVQAWMDSPGHRENILSKKYQEIGVAVLKCNFEDKITWLAVQHFGLPASACPQPEESLKTKIESNQSQIEELKTTLEEMKKEIEVMKPKRGEAYNQKVEQYNTLVSQYNNLINETEQLINQYNSQVQLFNDCATKTE
jgi:uncharacterized protein YkwD